MKNLLKIAVILLAVGIIAITLVWKLYVNKPHENIDEAMPSLSLTTEEIWKLYTDNPKMGDSLYTGKVIELTGSVSRIDKSDSLVSLIFVMDTDSMFGDKTISCQVYPKHNKEAATLIPGVWLKVKGVCIGYNDPDIKFNKCSIVK